MNLHSSSSVNGEGSTPKDPMYKILDELRSLNSWKEKQERKEKGKKKSGRNKSRWKSEEEEVGKSEKKKKKGNGERNVTWKRIELGKRLKGSEEN